MTALNSCPDFLGLRSFDHHILKIESEALKDNPLGDPTVRSNHCLLPKKPGDYKCVLFLSGFTSDGAKKFNFKGYDPNIVQDFDSWTEEEAIRPHIYLFVNAWTSWGGSQFINSVGCGNYEDYIVQDLFPALKESLPDSYNITEGVVFGGSSGGYGALHLASKYPETFTQSLCIAPDCDFELSLKNEIYHGLYLSEKYGGVKGVLESLKEGEINTHSRDFHRMINPLAMAACYSPLDEDGAPKLPVNREGDWDDSLWSLWLKKDPLYFLKERIENVKNLKNIFITVGANDQFLLQFGARKLHKLLKNENIEHNYDEFLGNHFDLDKPKKKVLSSL